MATRPVWDKHNERFIVENILAWLLMAVMSFSAVLAPVLFFIFYPGGIALICILPWPVIAIVGGVPIVYLLFRLRNAIFIVVDIYKDKVVLKGLYWWKRIHRADVDKVTLTPEIYSPDLEFSWSQKGSVLKIHLKNGKEISTGVMLNGLCYRIAGVLDPENHPEKAEWVEGWILENKWSES